MGAEATQFGDEEKQRHISLMRALLVDLPALDEIFFSIYIYMDEFTRIAFV